ncbi:hypothetical protein ACTXT7_001838 [Hymenolepis weldensis]
MANQKSDRIRVYRHDATLLSKMSAMNPTFASRASSDFINAKSILPLLYYNEKFSLLRPKMYMEIFILFSLPHKTGKRRRPDPFISFTHKYGSDLGFTVQPHIQ